MIDERKLSEEGLPADIHMERTILGAIMIDPGAASDAIGQLSAEEFSLTSHQTIYKRILGIMAAGSPVDETLVRTELNRHREMDSIGGIGYLLGMTEGIPRGFNVASYVRVVKEKAILRAAYHLGATMTEQSQDQSEDPRELLQRHAERISELLEGAEDSSLEHVSSCLAEQSGAGLAESMADSDGIRYGFHELDEATGGAHRGDLIIIAARPSMGKTALACCILRHMAVVERKTVAFFTLEQKKGAITRRMISASSRVGYQDIRSGKVGSYEQRILDEHAALLAGSSLYLDDQRGLTVARIRSKALRHKRELARIGLTLDAIVIDQLSKIDDADVYQRGMQRNQVVGKMTSGLKRIAQELDIPVILLVQIGREGGKRADNRPQLTDLKESGNIEEDADVVLFPHRPEYYDKTDDSLRGKGELILAKQREGPTKTCEVAYNGAIMRWEDLSAPAAKQDSFYEYQKY